ncbi:MAG: hypothetical protein JJT76_17610 [Clostridiaceae bacterium]|nr:hypothetical protein [Clostridiaceae bacterium]
MEIEALVEKITQEVMKQLKDRQVKSKSSYSKQALVFCSEASIDKGNILYQLEEKEIGCCFNDKYCTEEIESVDYVIIPTLSVASLAFIANGIEGDESSKVVIRSKLYGKEVLVLDGGIEYKTFKQTSEPALYELYEAYQGKLQDFGVKVGSLEEMLQFQRRQIQPPEAFAKKENKEGTYIEARLITENTLKQIECKENSSVYIKTKAIVTPMAKDYIRKKKIQIIRA